MIIAVIGATGLVGMQMVRILESVGIENITLIPVASSRSVGKQIQFRDEMVSVCSIDDAIAKQPSVALFSAGGDVSKKYAPLFAKQGTVVIDNSSAWRQQADIPLVVPEINGAVITKNHKIIANPNCSTIQLVMALSPIHSCFGVKRVIASTYQSVSGSGQKGIEQLKGEREHRTVEMAYPWPIDMNVIPQGGEFLENNYTTEEMKLVFETGKILNAPNIQVTGTVVRVPVTGGHSISAYVECEKNVSINEINNALKNMPGVTLKDNPKNNEYPMPLFSEGSDEVFVGRVRKDLFNPLAFNMWIVSDNLRKGAATNAVQIMIYMISNNLLSVER